MGIRLNKYVQENLGISRRKFVDLVQKNRVYVNDQKVESYSFVVESGDKLEIRYLKIDEVIQIDKNKKIDIIVFNKPIGVVCSRSDPHNKTIYDILPPKFANYFYVGRLDKDSRGLLIMTNDSSLVHKLEHPSSKVEKEYVVEINKPFARQDYINIKKGILDDGDLLSIKSIKFREDRRKFFVNIVLLEGKKRQIRRMLKQLGYHVLDLQRIREGNFVLGNVKEGNWIPGDLVLKKKKYAKKKV